MNPKDIMNACLELFLIVFDSRNLFCDCFINSWNRHGT